MTPPIRETDMFNNQNAFQNAGQNGYFNYQSVGNQTSTFFLLIITLILLGAFLRSEERYHKLVATSQVAIPKMHV